VLPGAARHQDAAPAHPQHEENGRAVAEFLSTHPKVSKLAYPGLKSHPQYDLAVKQQKGFGSMMSFELKSREEAERFLKAIKIFINAESLGGVESLASHSATTTHGSVSEECAARWASTRAASASPSASRTRKT
jgi:cystathionine beta-lyase/cystathionine gamma-synthase